MEQLFPIRAGCQTAGGEIQRDLLSMTGAGQGDNGSPGFLCHNLTHAQQRARLHTLGDGDEGCAFLQIGRDLAADTADGGGGGGDDHQRTTGHAGRIGGDGNASGKKYAGKPFRACGKSGKRWNPACRPITKNAPICSILPFRI